MVEKYRTINENLIEKYRKEKDDRLFRQLVIHELLQDDACFFHLPIDDVYQILIDLLVPFAELKKTYQELVSFQEYQRLIQTGKLEEA